MKKLIEVLAPFAVIARELTAIRELYEAELAAREKPIYRITETPGKSDTEVIWDEGDIMPKSKLRKLMEGLQATDDDDDEGLV